MKVQSKGAVARLCDQARAIHDRGEFPRDLDGKIDVHQVERILRLNIGTEPRVQILRRLMEAR